MNKDKFGFQNLAKRGLAVITAALSTFSQTKAEIPINSDYSVDKDKSINYENLHKNVLKPKLVLKLNVANPASSFVLMHSSHSSHRSHSSHSSHSSHYSSSYSSGSSYTPSPTPTYIPSSPTTNTPSSGSTVRASSSSNNASRVTGTTANSFYNQGVTPSPRATSAKVENTTAVTDSQHLKLGDRSLFKGCEGADVEMLQRLLMTFKKDMFVTGYFGLQTEIIVIKFQQDNELRPNGIVDHKTLNALINKVNGNSIK